MQTEIVVLKFKQKQKTYFFRLKAEAGTVFQVKMRLKHRDKARVQMPAKMFPHLKPIG
jgi:hypothetical protein